MTGEQVQVILDQQALILENLSRRKGKDKWDKLAIVSTFLSSIVIAVIGIYFTSTFKSQEVRIAEAQVRNAEAQLRISEAQVIEKFVPILSGTNENEKKGALLTISTLSNKSLAARLGSFYASPGVIEALEILYKNSEGENKDLLTEALLDALQIRTLSNSATYNQIFSDCKRILELRSKEELAKKNDGYYLADYYRAHGYANQLVGKYELALTEYNESLKIIPNYFRAFWNIAHLYETRRDNDRDDDKALHYYELAIKNNASPNIYLELGHFYADRRKFDKAIESYRTYIYSYPNDASAYYSLALVFAEKGDLSNALYHLDEAGKYATEPIYKAAVDNEKEKIKRERGINEIDNTPPVSPERKSPPSKPRVGAQKKQLDSSLRNRRRS